MAEEVEAGHQIGDHTFDHPDLELLPPAAVRDEIDRGADAIVHAGAPRPVLLRPPKGLTDDAVGFIAESGRYRTVFWELTLEHFVDHVPDPVAGVPPLLDKVRAGDIILAHDGGIPDRQRTLDALPALLDGLDRRGFAVVDVRTLLQHGGAVNVR